MAASVCYTVAKNGFQTAFMAQTEILARQPVSYTHLINDFKSYRQNNIIYKQIFSVNCAYKIVVVFKGKVTGKICL